MNFQGSETVDKRRLFILIAAFTAVYVFWGSTYLAIKYAIETLPPFLMAGGRFLVAGVILLVIARYFAKDYEKPSLKHWKTSFIVGTLLLLGGNGGVVFAQKYISSSLAALLVATEPFWIVLLSWLWLKKSRPNLKVVAGLFVGFIGVWLLIKGNSNVAAGSESMQVLGSFAIIVAALSWAVGSLYGIRASTPKSSILTAGMQMFSGGLVLLVVSLTTGEMFKFDIAQVSRNSFLGVVYLVIFGSLLGFTAYSWLLKNAQPARVSTYAYINPVVAVFLGWLIAGETFSAQMLVGAAIIVGSVALITSNKKDDSQTPGMSVPPQLPSSKINKFRRASVSA
ncbi:MAG: EamA family transporter [Pyrinomonadaceae bacterium]|nr:EamA family transporter [Pyrinomonadaceae bacterium]